MTLYQAVYVIFYHFGSVLLHNVQIKLGKHVEKKVSKTLYKKEKVICQCVNVCMHDGVERDLSQCL